MAANIWSMFPISFLVYLLLPLVIRSAPAAPIVPTSNSSDSSPTVSSESSSTAPDLTIDVPPRPTNSGTAVPPENFQNISTNFSGGVEIIRVSRKQKETPAHCSTKQTYQNFWLINDTLSFRMTQKIQTLHPFPTNFCRFLGFYYRSNSFSNRRSEVRRGETSKTRRRFRWSCGEQDYRDQEQRSECRWSTR